MGAVNRAGVTVVLISHLSARVLEMDFLKPGWNFQWVFYCPEMRLWHSVMAVINRVVLSLVNAEGLPGEEK